jgi:hypothetical protein
MSPERKRYRPFTLEVVSQLAKESTLKYGGHVPTVIAEGSKGRVVGELQDLPDTHEGRVQTMMVTGFGIAQTGEVGRLKEVFFISEAWMSRPADGSPHVLPSEDPARQEVLLVSSLNIMTQRGGLKVFEMKRDAEGQVVAVEDFHSEVTEENPLLWAFVDGFEMGKTSRVN